MPDDLERLSAYLDNALSSADRSALEARLATDEALRTELERLTRTVETLRAAPELAVPRNFTLDPAKYRRLAPWWARYQRMQMLASLGTVAAVVLIVAGVVLSRNQVGSPASSTSSTGAIAAVSTSVPSEEKDTTKEQSTLETAQRAVASPTPAPSMTAVGTIAAFASAPTGTSVPALAASTAQAAQDGAAAAPSETATATSTPMTLNAAAPQPMATGTSLPPMVAQTSAFKAATSAPTMLYSAAEPTSSNGAAETGGSGSVAPIAPPTMVMLQATQSADNLIAATMTVTLAPANTSVLITATQTATLATPTSAPTSAPTDQPLEAAAGSSRSLPMLIIIGVPLLVFCLMLLGIVWIRSRMR